MTATAFATGSITCHVCARPLVASASTPDRASLEDPASDLEARQRVGRIGLVAAATPQIQAFVGAHAREVLDHHEAGRGEAPHPGIDLVEIDRVEPGLAADPAFDRDIQRCTDADRDVAGDVLLNGRRADAELGGEILRSDRCAVARHRPPRQRPAVPAQAVQVLPPPLQVAGLALAADRAGHGDPLLHGSQNVIAAVDQPHTPHEEPRHGLGMDRFSRVLDVRPIRAEQVLDRILGIGSCPGRHSDPVLRRQVGRVQPRPGDHPQSRGLGRWPEAERRHVLRIGVQHIVVYLAQGLDPPRV